MPRDKDMESVQDQLQEILGLLKSQGADIADTKKMLADSQARVSQLEKKVSTLEREVKTLKEASNDRDQAAKSRSIRVFGVYSMTPPIVSESVCTILYFIPFKMSYFFPRGGVVWGAVSVAEGKVNGYKGLSRTLKIIQLDHG
jgi:hypothetical protein